MTNGDSLLVVLLSGDRGEGSAGPSVVALRFPRTEGLTGALSLSCMRVIEGLKACPVLNPRAVLEVGGLL